MERNCVFTNIDKLITPVGFFRVYSDSGEIIPFSVEKNLFDHPAEVYDDSDRVIGTISTETNYCIVIDTASLEIGKNYRIEFSAGKWTFCGSDEGTVCYASVIGDYAVGIGGDDPTENRGSRFEDYNVFPIDGLNGFGFSIFNDSKESIIFPVAWVLIDQFPAVEYEAGLDFWLT